MPNNKSIKSIINEDVRNEVLKGGFSLYLAFMIKFPGLDRDLDTLRTHNPDWCKYRAKKEASWLIDAKNAVNTLTSKFKEDLAEKRGLPINRS